MVGGGCILEAAAQNVDYARVAEDEAVDLDAATEKYSSGRYAEAIAALKAIERNRANAVLVRQEALRYLARAHLAQGEVEQARAALHDLLALEPPVVELNPDVESPPLMRLYYEARRAHHDSYEVRGAGPSVQTLAVMDFTNSSVDDFERFAPLQQGLPSIMINQINGATDLRVVERERIQWILEELELQQDAERIDQDTAVQLGRLLGAHAVLLGAFTVLGDQMWMSVRLVDVETGEVLLAEQVRGARDNFLELTENLSLSITEAINASLDAGTLGQQRETRDLNAVMAYAEGLVLLERKDYAGAYEKFQQALDHDPDYTRAAARATSLRHLLS